MKYGITRRVLGEEVFIEISGAEFAEAKAAKAKLMHVLFIEEKLDYILCNLLEFEREMLDAALDNMLFFDMSWSKSVAEMHTINRRILNLLTACRLYLDHVAHHIHQVYGKGSCEEEAFEAKISEQYGSHLGYRVMEAVRNYVQHRGIPVHMVTRHSQIVDKLPGSPAMNSVTPWLKVEALARDGKFKKSVLEELQAMGDKVDIKPLIRQYVASIGAVHLLVRDTFAGDIEPWEAVLSLVTDRFRQAGGGNTVGLAVVAIDDSGKWDEYVEVFDDFLERRRELERKNRNLTHFARRFVTSADYYA